MLAVDLDGGGDPLELEVPDLFPGVVVALSERASPPLASHGPDVALTGADEPPAPWVGPATRSGGLEAVSDGVAAAPTAAVTLVRLLRASARQPVETGLEMESLAYSVLQSGPEHRAWLAGREPPRSDAPPPDSLAGPAVLARRDGPLLELALNRPGVHNAYNRAMRDAMCSALAAAVADDTVAVELSGRGPSFCSGGDLTEFGTAPDPATAHLVRTSRSPARLLATLSARLGATLHGVCAGSGIELPAFAAAVRAHPDTRIWLPELSMGLIPGAGGTVSLPARIGRQRTAWMALTGRRIDAGTARRWGLVDELTQ